jgi:hypothetical protein
LDNGIQTRWRALSRGETSQLACRIQQIASAVLCHRLVVLRRLRVPRSCVPTRGGADGADTSRGHGLDHRLIFARSCPSCAFPRRRRSGQVKTSCPDAFAAPFQHMHRVSQIQKVLSWLVACRRHVRLRRARAHPMRLRRGGRRLSQGRRGRRCSFAFGWRRTRSRRPFGRFSAMPMPKAMPVVPPKTSRASR